MSISISGEQMPYVRFEYRAVEDRAATIKEGRLCTKDVAFAFITPAGGKDETEKIAEEWLADMQRNAQMPGREYLARWHSGFKSAYEAFKAGQEIPAHGTPIRLCLAFKPSEAQAILGANIRTLEDLAVANEEAIGRMGIGGREFKMRAEQMIKTSRDVGAASEEISALKARMELLEKQLEEKTQENKDLASKVVRQARAA